MASAIPSACAGPDVAVGGTTGQQAMRPGRDAWSLAAGSALAFAGLVLVAVQPEESWLGRLDKTATMHVCARRNKPTILLARAVSAAAEPAVAALPLAAAAIAAARRRGWQAGCLSCVTVVTGMAVRRRLSQRVGRQRPPKAIWLAEPEGFSLPSKHTCLAALTAGSCASALGAGMRTGQTAALIAAMTAGASRIYLGVHWPADVISAWLFAAGWLILADLVPAPAGQDSLAVRQHVRLPVWSDS